MESIYTKSKLSEINRGNSFEYRLARNIATKYGQVYACPWSALYSEGNPIKLGVEFRVFHESEAFAKNYENLNVQSWA